MPGVFTQYESGNEAEMRTNGNSHFFDRPPLWESSKRGRYLSFVIPNLLGTQEGGERGVRSSECTFAWICGEEIEIAGRPPAAAIKAEEPNMSSLFYFDFPKKERKPF